MASSSSVVAGAGYGAQPERADAFRAESMLTAAAFAAEGAAKVAERYAVGPARVQFQNKNPRGWAEFAAALAEHSSLGSALTMRGVQAARPSLYELTDQLAKVRTPVLVLVGDEDEGCLEPALMLKRTIPTAGLTVLPRTGHTANLEEPDVFNQAVDRFLTTLARGAWRERDPRSVSASTTGMSYPLTAKSFGPNGTSFLPRKHRPGVLATLRRSARPDGIWRQLGWGSGGPLAVGTLPVRRLASALPPPRRTMVEAASASWMVSATAAPTRASPAATRNAAW